MSAESIASRSAVLRVRPVLPPRGRRLEVAPQRHGFSRPHQVCMSPLTYKTPRNKSSVYFPRNLGVPKIGVHGNFTPELQEQRELEYKLRFCSCRGCVAELHRETTDYYITSFADSRRGKSGMVGFGTISMVYHKFVNYAKVCFALRAAWRI